MALLKQLVARMPSLWQEEIKRLRFGYQIRLKRFRTDEPEFDLLPQLISAGDWALDVGANVGHYTMRLSDLVGETGRVIAFEPIPATFALLAANARLFKNQNVTLINGAASSASSIMSMVIPRFATGLENYYQAHIVAGAADDVSRTDVLGFAIDSLQFSGNVRLVKIDAEGHEDQVLLGMKHLLKTRRPILIVEGTSAHVATLVSELGYEPHQLPGSPNTMFMPPSAEPPLPIGPPDEL